MLSDSEVLGMNLCKHSSHKIIDDIWQPRYHDDAVLISKHKLGQKTEWYLIKFTKCNKYKDWYLFKAKDIKKQKTQKNGNGEVYVVPMSLRVDFVANKTCEHDLK